jgi:hypothetical protein
VNAQRENSQIVKFDDLFCVWHFPCKLRFILPRYSFKILCLDACGVVRGIQFFVLLVHGNNRIEETRKMGFPYRDQNISFSGKSTPDACET